MATIQIIVPDEMNVTYTVSDDIAYIIADETEKLLKKKSELWTPEARTELYKEVEE